MYSYTSTLVHKMAAKLYLPVQVLRLAYRDYN
jgi:hypothetical protein